MGRKPASKPARRTARRTAAESSDAVHFEKLDDAVNKLAVGGRDPNAALLIWFLQHVKRLDVEEAIDAVCDGHGDKGIDGLWVDTVSEEINILQGKRRVSVGTTQGDSDLQKLLGAVQWFQSPERVDDLLRASPNEELRSLVERQDIKSLLDDDYKIRCVFVTNTKFNRAGRDYADAHLKGSPPLEGWDLLALEPYVRYADRVLYINEDRKLTFAPQAHFRVDLPGAVEVTYGAIAAEQVAALPGIADRTLFAQNVRSDLGRTRVNKDIQATLQDPQEHPRFLTFHNGLTILCQNIKPVMGDPDSVTISGFSVVNGCQSVIALYSNQKDLTDKLLVPVRLVQVADHADLAEDITYRSNNQNAINLRDLRANDSTQIFLQGQFNDFFPGRVQYQIKRGEDRGEDSTAPVVIPNDLAGQFLLALYNGEPWMSHRKFDLFDQRYKDVFNPRIKAPQIYLGWIIFDEVRNKLSGLDNQLMARYGLTTFVLIYLAGRLMAETADGRALLDDPLEQVRSHESSLRKAIAQLIGDILIDFNAYVEEQEQRYKYFDYKTAFKNQTAVELLAGDVIRQHKRAVLRNDDIAFHVK